MLNNSADVAGTRARSRVARQLAAESDDGYLQHINASTQWPDGKGYVESIWQGKDTILGGLCKLSILPILT